MTGFDPDKHIDALAPALGLDIRPDWRPGVAGFLLIAAGMAQLVEEAVDDLSAEAAPIFRPEDIGR